MTRYIIFIGVLTITSALLSGVAVAAGDVEIVLEAELADTITEPMVIAVPDDAKEFNAPVVPNEPSNGEFVWAPGEPATGGANDHRGYAEFIIDIPEDDTYAIWGYVIAWDGNSDSFWVTWRPADPDEDAQATQNTQFRWGVQQGPAWHWDRINHWLNAGTFDREWELEKGESTLRIGTREAATMLDCLYITNDIGGGQANARLPTDEDRKLQEQGAVDKSVESVGKLSTTWGSVKSLY